MTTPQSIDTFAKVRTTKPVGEAPKAAVALPKPPARSGFYFLSARSCAGFSPVQLLKAQHSKASLPWTKYLWMRACQELTGRSHATCTWSDLITINHMFHSSRTDYCACLCCDRVDVLGEILVAGGHAGRASIWGLRDLETVSAVVSLLPLSCPRACVTSLSHPCWPIHDIISPVKMKFARP